MGNAFVFCPGCNRPMLPPIRLCDDCRNKQKEKEIKNRVIITNRLKF